MAAAPSPGRTPPRWTAPPHTWPEPLPGMWWAHGWRRNARFPSPMLSAKLSPPLWKSTLLAPPGWTRMSSGWRYWTCSTCVPPPSSPYCTFARPCTPIPPPTATSTDTSTAGKTSTRQMSCGRRWKSMLIERKRTADLIPADYNPRKDLKPGDPEYDKLKRSMEQFGYVEPVIWNKTTGRVVGGHQRLKVLMDMGVTEVECVVVELNEEREKALNIALNKISGDWDKDKLMLLISDLQGADFDVSLTGFDPAEIDDLFKDSLKDGVKEDDFDVDAELENPAITKAGDVWTLGRHRLICGDSTKAETFSLLMDGLKANLVITDPPYNVNYEGSAGKIKNDNMENAAFYDFLLAAFQNTAEAMADDASIYVFHADTEGLNFRKAFSDAGFYLSGTCIWKKQSLVLGRSPYQWQHEPILFGWKKKGRHQWYTGRKESTIWEFDKPKKNKDHPTMKPIPLLAYPILNSSMSNAIVLDPFGGSGSTLIACEQTDRICRTIELDEKFCDVIVKRYIEQVGKADEVSLLRDGLTYRYAEVAGDDAEDIPLF
nr:MAG TPA: adenine specific DNA methyltransferase [Caudoviricetes sp.]